MRFLLGLFFVICWSFFCAAVGMLGEGKTGALYGWGVLGSFIGGIWVYKYIKSD